MPRTTLGSAHHEDGPLIATPQDPAARNGLSRRGRVIVLVVIAALVVVAVAIGLAAVAHGQVVPAPSLSAPAPESTPSPTSTDAASAGGITTTELDGQPVWLSSPSAAPVGLAVLFPGAEED